jgi:hypothetical protein
MKRRIEFLGRRREFIALLGGAAAWPLAARAQQATSPRRVGFLLVGLSPESKEVQVFRRELRKAGYIEGRNLVMEWRSANGGRIAPRATDRPSPRQPSDIKVLYRFHQNNGCSKCEVAHTSPPIRPSQSALATLVCCQEGNRWQRKHLGSWWFLRCWR